MSIENEIAGLTQSTTDLLEAVNTKKSTLDSAVDTAEAAKVVATSKAAEATTVVADASTHATNASNSATQAAASAASASQIVTGVATGLPNIRPSLNLDFVNSKIVDSRIDFTRSTTASYYDGKATVKAEENLATYSNDFTGWSVARASLNRNTVIAPDGTTTASRLTQTGTTTYGPVYKNSSSYPSYDGVYTISVYAKHGTSPYFVVLSREMATGASFDLSAGTVGEANGCTASITSVGNGWYRCSITTTSTNVSSGSFFGNRDVLSLTITTASDGNYTDVWGAQVEQRDTITAYTPTAGTPITNYIPVLKTAGINEPRLDHDPVTGECKGLLIERDRTNYVNNSSDFTVGSVDWGYSTADRIKSQNNVAIAPDGTLTAGKVIPTGTSHRLGGHMSLPGSMVEGATYTMSGFYKHDGSYWTQVALGGVFGGEAAVFDFISGAFVSTDANVTRTSAVNVGNGWWRLAVTYVFQNHIGNLYPYALVAQCKQANGSTAPLDSAEYNGVYIWGMQYEKAYYPSSYIPTDGATVTRASDDAFMDLSSLNIGNEFSYVMTASKESATAGWSRYFTLRDLSNGDSTIAALNPSGHLYFETKHRTANIGSFYRQYDFVDGQEVTIGGSLTNDQLIYDTSGSSVFTDSTGRSPVEISLLYLGDVGNQHTKNFKLYNQAISASELEALTQE